MWLLVLLVEGIWHLQLSSMVFVCSQSLSNHPLASKLAEPYYGL